jgi:hypothetical protein
MIVGQNVLAAAADKRAEATYNDADAVLHEAVKIQEHLLAQDKVLGSMIGKLDARRPWKLSGGLIHQRSAAFGGADLV